VTEGPAGRITSTYTRHRGITSTEGLPVQRDYQYTRQTQRDYQYIHRHRGITRGITSTHARHTGITSTHARQRGITSVTASVYQVRSVQLGISDAEHSNPSEYQHLGRVELASD